MIVEARKHEGLLHATGAGAFGKVEYDGETKVLLRTAAMKTADLSGTLRVYFNNHREQVMTGRRFDPMPSGLLLLRPGAFYRVYTTIEIVEPLPRGLSAMVVLNDDTSDVMLVTTAPFREGFSGPVCFTVQPFRKIEVELMTSFGGLILFEDVGISAVKKEVKAEIKRALKTSNSDRTKKSLKSTKKKASVDAVVEEADEGGVPDEHTDDTKN